MNVFVFCGLKFAVCVKVVSYFCIQMIFKGAVYLNYATQLEGQGSVINMTKCDTFNGREGCIDENVTSRNFPSTFKKKNLSIF